jgi:hypothetical protein
METFYLVTFAVVAVLCVALELSKQREGKSVSNAAFLAFRNNYLFVYALMMAGDWLQVRVLTPFLLSDSFRCECECICVCVPHEQAHAHT